MTFFFLDFSLLEKFYKSEIIGLFEIAFYASLFTP